MKALSAIAKEISRCRKCSLWKARKNPVPGEGSPKAKLMLIGEAPGREEDKQGKPFVGGSGKLLTEALHNAGIERKDVFITSVLKCRPPNNRNPKKEEITACIPFLLKQIDAVNPMVIVPLGNIAMKALLGYDKVMKHHGKAIRKEGKIFFPTLHPAAVARLRRLKTLLEADLKKAKTLK